jgi:cation-transporting P-type ATPase I
VLPVVVGGGLVVIIAGLLWRRPLAVQLAVGAGTAIAAVPEGLPLLAGLGEAAVARRLARQRTLVRRLAAVEALGRVDVACVDKTGTLTENRLTLTLVATPDGAESPSESMSGDVRDVLRVAALASPRLGSSGAAAHGTDVAVLEGAQNAGLGGELEAHRDAEMPFDPRRPFHASIIGGRMCVKGSAEELVGRCTTRRRGGQDEKIGRREREALLARTAELSAEGLRVLMVAEGPASGDPSDPSELVALGFLGIGDTLRPGVDKAIERCRTAGIRVVMLTGDHPATARTIAREVGLTVADDGILTGPQIAELDDDTLADELEGISVVARIAPLEKVRIVEALRKRGHVVAMTGDGVNDAPALRLADVGVAMGEAGTEVARQASDLILSDDEFRTLVDALIEGRTFWGNLRRALAMLLGGNLGEVCFIAALTSLGAASPLTSRQILAVNLVSDVLPAISLVVQSPKQRDLRQLSREGHAALGGPLRREIAGRAVATALPAGLAYLAAVRSPAARSVGFAAIVSTQLAQTLETSIATGRASRATVAAVAASVGFLVAALHQPHLRRFLGLAAPGLVGWLLVAAAAAAAAVTGRILTAPVHRNESA